VSTNPHRSPCSRITGIADFALNEVNGFCVKNKKPVGSESTNKCKKQKSDLFLFSKFLNEVAKYA
jgi:hypothetical protein